MNTLNDLIANISNAPEDFNHLKVFLHRDHTILEPEFGREFLYVSYDSFGLVRLKDLSAEDNYVNLVLEDSFTGQSSPFTIDINNKSIRFMMIAWEDVQDIFYQHKNTSRTHNDLLEFEF